MRRYLARHFAELLGGQLAADDAFTQAGVRLVLEVDEQGADLAPVFRGRAAKVGKHGLFDRDRTVGDEIAGWTRVRWTTAWEEGLTSARVTGETVIDELGTSVAGVVARDGDLDAVRLAVADLGFAVGRGRGDRRQRGGLLAD